MTTKRHYNDWEYPGSFHWKPPRSQAALHKIHNAQEMRYAAATLVYDNAKARIAKLLESPFFQARAELSEYARERVVEIDNRALNRMSRVGKSKRLWRLARALEEAAK